MFDELKSLKEKFELIRREKDILVRQVALLEASRREEVGKKISNSFSGNAAQSLIVGTAQLAALTLERIWDPSEENPLTVAISADGLNEEIKQDRLSGKLPNWDEDLLGLDKIPQNAKELVESCNQYMDSELRKRLRIYRTEQLAHNKRGNSRDRHKLGAGLQDFSVTFDDISTACEITLKIVDRLSSLINFHVEGSQSQMALYIGYAAMFWDACPVFSDVENLALLDVARD